jgi:hypothetical protein
VAFESGLVLRLSCEATVLYDGGLSGPGELGEYEGGC